MAACWLAVLCCVHLCGSGGPTWELRLDVAPRLLREDEVGREVLLREGGVFRFLELLGWRGREEARVGHVGLHLPQVPVLVLPREVFVLLQVPSTGCEHVWCTGGRPGAHSHADLHYTYLLLIRQQRAPRFAERFAALHGGKGRVLLQKSGALGPGVDQERAQVLLGRVRVLLPLARWRRRGWHHLLRGRHDDGRERGARDGGAGLAQTKLS